MQGSFHNKRKSNYHAVHLKHESLMYVSVTVSGICQLPLTKTGNIILQKIMSYKNDKLTLMV